MSVVAVGAFFLFLVLFGVFYGVPEAVNLKMLWQPEVTELWRVTSVLGGLSLLECQLQMPVLYSSEKLHNIY